MLRAKSIQILDSPIGGKIIHNDAKQGFFDRYLKVLKIKNVQKPYFANYFAKERKLLKQIKRNIFFFF